MSTKKNDFGVKAFIIKDNKFLVMHNNGVKEDLWELPGGRLEFIQGKLSNYWDYIPM